MKKLKFSFIVLLFLFALCGCKATKPTSSKTTTSKTTVSQTTKSTNGSVTTTLNYDAILLAAKQDKKAVKITGVADTVNKDFQVVDSISYTYEGQTYTIALSWKSSNTNVISFDGLNATVTRPTDGDIVVVVTCTLSLNGHQIDKEFELNVYKAEKTTAEIIAEAKDELDNIIAELNPTNVTNSVTLPSIAGLALVTWTSKDLNTMSSTGDVYRPRYGEGDKQVVLLAKITSGADSQEFEYTFTIKELERPADSELPDLILSYIEFANTKGITENITLPTVGKFDSVINWVSSNEAVISSTGVVTQPKASMGSDLTVLLTANVKIGDYEATKKFIFTVPELEPVNNQEKAMVAFNKLKLNYTVVAKNELILPASSDYNSTISYESLSDRVIVDGTKLTFDKDYQDTPVYLNAKITIDNEEIIIKFGFILKADNKGNGTVENPYVIESIEDFLKIGKEWPLNGNYVLYDDLDFTGINYTPIGTKENKFTGSLNGYGHTLSNLTIKYDAPAEKNGQKAEESYLGLFGYTHGAQIENLIIRNFDIKGDTFVSAFVGFAESGIYRNIFIYDSNVEGTRNSDNNDAADTQVGALFGSATSAAYEEVELKERANLLIDGASLNNVIVKGAAHVGLVAGCFRNVYTWPSATDAQAIEIALNTYNAVMKNVYANGTVYGVRYSGAIIGSGTGWFENIVSDVKMMRHENPDSKGINSTGGFAGGLAYSNASQPTDHVTLKNVIIATDFTNIKENPTGRAGILCGIYNGDVKNLHLINTYQAQPVYNKNGSADNPTAFSAVETLEENLKSIIWVSSKMTTMDLIERWSMVEGELPKLVFDKNVGLETYAVEYLLNVPEEATENINLVKETFINGVVVTWTSNKPEYISDNGVVNKPAYFSGDALVTLTATYTTDGQTRNKEFTVLVKETLPTKEEKFETINREIKASLGSLEAVTKNLVLLTASETFNATVEWLTNNEAVVSSNGIVTRPEYGQQDALVKLTAVVTIEGETMSFDYNVTVLAWTKDKKALNDVYDLLVIDEIITANVELTTVFKVMVVSEEVEVIVTWESLNSAITNTGIVTRPKYIDGDATGKLIATITAGDVTTKKEFDITVLKLEPTEADLVDQAFIEFEAVNKVIEDKLELPLTFPNGSKFTNFSFVSGNENSIISITMDGDLMSILVINRPTYEDGDKEITVSITISNGAAQYTKDITFNVLKNKGDGTKENPYLIDSIEDLEKIKDLNYYLLKADIDLSSKYGEGKASWTPISGFKGVFDGGNHVISGLYVNGGQYSAFFKSLGDGAVIKNVIFENAIIITNNTYSSVVCGKVEQNSSVTMENINILNASFNCTAGATNGQGNCNSGLLIGMADLRGAKGELKVNNIYVEGTFLGGAGSGMVIGQIQQTSGSFIFENVYAKGRLESNKQSAAFFGVVTANKQAVEGVYGKFINCVSLDVVVTGRVPTTNLTSVGAFGGSVANNDFAMHNIEFINCYAGELLFEGFTFDWHGTFLARFTTAGIIYNGAYAAKEAFQANNNSETNGAYAGVVIPEEFKNDPLSAGFSTDYWYVTDGKLLLKKLM